MLNKNITCAILGAQEQDLFVLGELHKRENIRIAFVYDPNPFAVGLEIAEILRIPRFDQADSLPASPLDYIIVSKQRERFENEIERLTGPDVKILTHNEALDVLCGTGSEETKPPATEDAVIPYTLDDALMAFERLLDRKELLKFLLDVAVKAAKASAGSIMLYSKEAEELYIAYAIGLSERVIRNTRQKLGVGIAGTVAEEKRAKLIHPRNEAAFHSTDKERMDITSAICVPLLRKGALLGVLNVSSGPNDSTLDESDLQMLKQLSKRISRVLHESLKFQEVQLRHREISLRGSVGELSEKPITYREKFSLLSSMVADLTGAVTAEIFVSTHEGDWFVLGGSNRSAHPNAGRILFDKGALSRCLIERKGIILTESTHAADDLQKMVSSIVFSPLALTSSLGVLVLEFSARHKLDEFLAVKDSISQEISHFIAFALRERRLQRELEAMNRVSDFAPSILSCKTASDLSELLSRVVSDVLECTRVSVRISPSGGLRDMSAAYHEPAGERSQTWQKEDEERYQRLQDKRSAFSLAFLNFTPTTVEPPPSYHSILAIPIQNSDSFYGGIIAYDKHPQESMDDATFIDLDQSVIQSLLSLVIPVIGLLSDRATPQAPSEEAAYSKVLQDNCTRLKSVCQNEMSRSDRYHHSFSAITIQIPPLKSLFQSDRASALRLVDDISQGIQTRTRKSDYGAWTGLHTYGMVNLEGSRRARFLISRLVQYLRKDLSSALRSPLESGDILVGLAIYPGKSKNPDDLFNEAHENLAPYIQE
ncbi:MAG: GAF domain-containing protein [Candidatus Latescibacterota bacterium]